MAKSRRTPLVIAHRGASDEIAEHTLAAYQEAIDAGADAVECDVRLTADTVLVCVHDRRIDRTSDGRGVVANHTLAQLQQRDFGSWKRGWVDDVDAEVPTFAQVSSQVLTLDALLDLVEAADRPVGLSIETKHPSRFGRLVEELLVQTLDARGFLSPHRPKAARIRVMSFAEVALRRMRRLAPQVPRVLLMDRIPIRCRSGWLPYGARYAGPGIEVIREHPRYVRRVHEAGGKVHVWTVDDPADVEFCLAQRVDGIITNRPRAVLEQIAAEGLSRGAEQPRG
ncbi:MAG: glycerophosphodiester phosphodiesterase [Actinobacteria bacterium]|nr:glycerophosphodiester phosphodiesterase [Actinomycetota bacterium]MCB9411514.1 glycerophosphodiester phosphodiesterase [Actinomycetota bacterium]